MHILFLVHGMGRQQIGWADPVINHLRKKTKQFKYFTENDFSDHVIIEPLRYDHVFDDLLSRWKDDFEGIMASEAEDSIPDGRLRALMEEMDREEVKFFWSHIADVLIYRFFPPMRQRIRIELIRTIAKKVQYYRDRFGNNTHFSFVAHSLGTAVIHDSLHLMGATEWDDEVANVMGPPHTRFQALYMLANTCLCLQSDINVESSIVCPVGSKGDKSKEYFDQYVNVLHEYDPITLLWRLDGESWGGNFKQLKLSHIRDLNVHDFTHYLDHPGVHIPLLRTLFGFNSVTPAEQKLVVHTYKDIDRAQVTEEVKKRFDEATSNLNEDSALMDLIRVWVRLKELVGGDFIIPA